MINSFKNKKSSPTLCQVWSDAQLKVFASQSHSQDERPNRHCVARSEFFFVRRCSPICGGSFGYVWPPVKWSLCEGRDPVPAPLFIGPRTTHRGPVQRLPPLSRRPPPCCGPAPHRDRPAATLPPSSTRAPTHGTAASSCSPPAPQPRTLSQAPPGAVFIFILPWFIAGLYRYGSKISR